MDIEKSCRAFLNDELRVDLALYVDDSRRQWEQSYDMRRFAYWILKPICPTLDRNPWRDLTSFKEGFVGKALDFPDFLRASKWLREELVRGELIDIDNDRFRFRQDPESIFNVQRFLILLADSVWKVSE